MHFALFTTRALFVTKNHQSNGYAMSPTSVSEGTSPSSSETSIFRALSVTKNRQSCGYLRASRKNTILLWLASLLLLLTCSVMTLAQTAPDSEWIIFVSQHTGGARERFGFRKRGGEG